MKPFLKPCPFCGSNVIEEMRDHDEELGIVYTVFCAECSTKKVWDNRRAAIKAWNYRPLESRIAVNSTLNIATGVLVGCCGFALFMLGMARLVELMK
jgi:Lar family restriction alleviation protein